jgi:anti-sigma-K factor RskA
MIEPEDIDGIAAEIVLGTLPHDEYDEAIALKSVKLNAAIKEWEIRLAPLNEDTPNAVPSPDLFNKIERQLLLKPPAPNDPDRLLLARHAQRWRILALAACTALAIISGFALNGSPSAENGTRAVAVLQATPSAPAFLVSLDSTHATLSIQTLAATAPAEKDYELWIIAEGAPAPRSLGVLPSQGNRLVKLSSIDSSAIRNATLAVSVEPRGGSPTGAPTGPVVFTGKFL